MNGCVSLALGSVGVSFFLSLSLFLSVSFILRMDEMIQQIKDIIDNLVLAKACVRPLKQSVGNRRDVVIAGRLLADSLGGTCSPKVTLVKEKASA